MRARKNAVAPENRKTVAYPRVSSRDQATEGVCLDAQEARIVAYCAAMGWHVSEVIRDAGESAKSLQRPRNGHRARCRESRPSRANRRRQA